MEQKLKNYQLKALKKSGIDGETAQKCMFRYISAENVQQRTGRQCSICSGYTIPYFDPFTGKVLRVNYRNPPFVRVGLDDPQKAQGAKYLSLAYGRQPYIPPIIAKEVVKGLDEIIITVGEKNAIAACIHGFPTIGILGSYGWKVTKKMEILPLLKKIIGINKTVTVIWDSDSVINGRFAQDTLSFHSCLWYLGCTLKVIVLPMTGSIKIGLNDYLLIHGPESFKNLLKKISL